MTRAVRAAAGRDVPDDDVTADELRAVGRTPAWLVERALALVVGIREREPRAAVRTVTADLDWPQLRALAVTLAAMCRADVDPAAALEWVDLPPAEWSDTTVVVEEGRWMDGARDYTAGRGRGQWDARRRRAGAS